MQTQPPPVLTIITVTFNAARLLEGTIRSVLEQTYPHIEFLIFDGASIDGTLEILRRLPAKSPNRQITKWSSEPDRGLYDAMNKGLRRATGDFVWFLNAGDHLFEKDTVEKIMRHCKAETDVLIGEVKLEALFGERWYPTE
ncbi:MAG: glycosyltransferase, partial [Bacteroidota bacterium]